ncbi:hypothetical protein J4450_07705 [Candidatus Micrarchaeota archaeon]|nr:hypothetical protein [Candidatus Micrarchaeota archaeon]
MLSIEEISELKKTQNHLEGGMKKIEKNQRASVVTLSQQLEELIIEIELTLQKQKSLWNPSVSTRIRIAKKGITLSKELTDFEIEVANEFEKRNISEDIGKRLVSIIKLIKNSMMEDAKKEFEYFSEIINLSKRYEQIEEEIKDKDKVLKREQLKLENLLAEMSALEKETIDLEKVHKHENLSENLKKLEEIRAAYLHSLASESVLKLLDEVEKYSLKEYDPIFPGKDEITELKKFLSEYTVFGRCNASQLCDFFEYSEKKLSHVCSETSRFKRVIMENRNFFETINSLKQTTFLAVDDENENIMNFYAERMESARYIVGQIREIGKGKHLYKEEYEKNKQNERRKEEFSKYSKKDLEAELVQIKSLLELLNADYQVPGGQSSATPIEEKKGLLSSLYRMFRNL